jgi:hypothetical protein
MSEGTLRKWISNFNQKDSLPTPAGTLPVGIAAASWMPSSASADTQRYHSLMGPDLHTWCRDKDLFKHQLKA